MSLILPTGVRLAERAELPGPARAREEAWSRIQSAALTPGYLTHESTDSRFSVYLEANVDAPNIWPLFTDLCTRLLSNSAVLLVGDIDDDDQLRSNAATAEALIAALKPHAYQLSNDGCIQIGMLEETSEHTTEVLIAPTKHFKIWVNDRDTVEQCLHLYGVQLADALEFLDEYPRTTLRLPEDKYSFNSTVELIEYVNESISAKRN